MGRSEPLGQQVIAGFAWMASQAVLAKALALAGQMVLAYILGPSVFGLVGLAYTVSSFASLVQQGGVSGVLVHRQVKFRRWANAAFWMSLTAGIVAALLMVVAAPLAAWFYQGAATRLGSAAAAAARGQLTQLVLVLAIAAPLNSLTIVPMAQLQNQMRFRAITLVSVWMSVGNLGLSIVLAWRGWGAMSIVAPQPIVAAGTAAWLWMLARPPIRWRLQVRRWRYIFRDSGTMLLATFFLTFTLHGGAIVLGLFHGDDAVVGVFSFAYNLSLQTTTLLTASLGGVLFTALSKLQREPARQRAAFVRAVRSMALVGVPLCLLQAAVARPLLELLFRDRWLGAVTSLQVLSVAMALQLANAAAINFLQAQGRFTTVLRLSIVCGTLFIAMVTAGALLGGATSVSVAVAVYNVVIGLTCLYLALRPFGGRWGEVLPIYLTPLALGAVAVGAGWATGVWLPPMRGRNALAILLACAVSAGSYVPLARWLARDSLADVTAQLAALLQRRKRTA